MYGMLGPKAGYAFPVPPGFEQYYLPWVQSRFLPPTVSLPPGGMPYYQFTLEPPKTARPVINTDPQRVKAFQDWLMRTYEMFERFREGYRAKQSFLEQLMEAYGMGKGKSLGPGQSSYPSLGPWF
jgi:hypothetical protein